MANKEMFHVRAELQMVCDFVEFPIHLEVEMVEMELSDGADSLYSLS